MKQTPCEYMIWNGLPFIRREIAETLIDDFGLSQKEVAERLGVTPAAICQYRAKKRGRMKIKNQIITKEITISAERIIKNDDISIMEETCRICKIMRNNGIHPFFNNGSDK
ncbi:MAG: transcriptional regulator [Candidatus Thermoplasmatota archaeon]|nr:transcriptional regulator [Candidatus Thermoplasmatota archaeon]